MKQAKIFSIIVVITLGLYGLVGFYYLPLASFEGTLTRMAMLPESDFGWTKAQPTIDSKFMGSASWDDADVLAIGDSFTYAQIWQTELTRHGLHVRTETWEGIANICGDFSNWLREKGFRGKYVVIESAEMYFENRIAKSVSCDKTRIHQIAEIHVQSPITLPDRQHLDYSGQLSVGIQTKLNDVRYDQLNKKQDFKSWAVSKDVRLQRLDNGCSLFSHLRCMDVLFYTKDRNDDFDETIFKNMEIINYRLSGYKIIWAVVPDKSTVYLHPDKKFWDEVERKFHAPNILKTFRQAIQRKTIDLYRGNDTHLSTTGYLIMGDAVYQSMRR